MKTKLFLPLLSLLIFGCLGMKDELKFDPEIINYFDKSFIDHFPDEVPVAYHQASVSQNISNSHPHIRLKYYAQDVEFDSVKEYLVKNAVAIYNSDDTCLVVLDRHLNNDNWYKIDKTLRVPKKIPYPNKDCLDGKLPVPKLYDPNWGDTNTTSTGLKGYKLYLIEAKSGLHLEKEKLPNGLYTPAGWEHGISKGIALREDDNSIIYWSEVW
ncbi:hypothetical protein C9994_11115 [Marivirga lumbricoides]|uniref:Uncharacterized protein n=1 Tax=Marivirga lumbricoides TaxID=1046115 RepID=A0A2T4DP12_9BACT|nr:hypothetical protein C9994_11115 [Marivirga lumbricoides]